MFKRITSAAFLAILMLCAVLLATGCNKPKSGKVTWIGFVPPHNERRVQMAIGSNPPAFVTTSEWIPDTTWYLKFSNGKKEREICVSREDAYKYKIGDGIELTDD